MKDQLCRRALLLLVTCAVVLVPASPAPASDEGQAAADEVDLDSYRDFLDLYLYTHVGDDRGFGPEHDLARDNIVMLMESYGLTVTLEPFTYFGTTYYNVVGTQVGTVAPDQEYVVGAHFDSVDNPGADDDASGTALVLEVARILSQYESDHTIRFVAFDREEQGLYGSEAYVQAHMLDDILGMIQADMVAYDPGTWHARIYGDTVALPLKNDMLAAVEEYGGILTAADYGWNGQSDHAPFAYAGFQACLLIEGEVWNNPYYHSSQDTFENPDNLNFEYAVTMVRSVVGYMVDHAGVQVPVDTLSFGFPDGLPEHIDPSGGQRLRVRIEEVGSTQLEPGTELLHVDIGGGWESVPLEWISDDLYDAVFPAAPCPEEVRFYVSVESTTGETYTQPRNAPASHYSALATHGRLVYFEDDFETETGWAVSGSASDGQWARGIPIGGGDRGDPPSDFDGSGHCYLTDNVDGNSDVDGGYTHLDSPIIDLSEGDALIHYALWYTNDYGSDPDNDLFKTYVSDNGGASWTLVEVVGPESTPGWFEHTFDVGDFVTPSDQVRVRFEASDLGDGSVVEAGIDDFSVFNYDCETSCPTDIDGSGDVGFADLLAVLSAWGVCDACPEDIDDSGDVGFADLLAVLSAWGPCPAG